MISFACHRTAARTLAALLISGMLSNVTQGADPHPEWTLYSPYVGSTNTYLLDLAGTIVQTWPSSFTPGASVYLLEEGAILRTCRDLSVGTFGGPGRGGRLQRIAWDGTVEWSYPVAGEDFVQHHDVEVLPNGNILAIVWERYTNAEAIAAGRNPASTGISVWAEAILEIEPSGASGGTTVWSWHAWDWLVQDFDPGLPNYGDPADFPGRIDINFAATVNPDWLHCNGIDYNEELDQIVLSCHNFDEIWIISHAPADSGELLYRWGNPQAYGRGSASDQRLFAQHDPKWIPEGVPGAGNLTVFNNGVGRGYSSIDEITPPVNPDGTYHLEPSQPYGPVDVTWTCDEIDGEQFFAMVMSGVQRLPNGNHLICLAQDGHFIEVDETCSTAWDYESGSVVFKASRIDARDPRLAGLLFCPSDLDGDGDVDLTDFNTFAGCMDGPDVAVVSGCELADIDTDGDVDLADFAAFQEAFTGP
ncbi:MAG: aryl-sulfate sulfotransferase [Phycisphaerales bacterium]|nr:MAG: aryl-sulfate sulfotransferase [Phycisphaerales bacterium]